MGRVRHWVYRAGVAAVVALALGVGAWLTIAPPSRRAPRVAAAFPFGGAPRALPAPEPDAVALDAIPPAPLGAAPGAALDAAPPPFMPPAGLRAGLAGPEAGVGERADAPDTPLARLAEPAPHILALAPAGQRPPSPFDTLEPVLPPVRPDFDDLDEPAAPLPPRRPRGLAPTTPDEASPPAAAMPAPATPAPAQTAAAPTAAAPSALSIPGLLALAPTTPPPIAPPLAPSVPTPSVPTPDAASPRLPAGAGQMGSPVFVRIFKKEGALELFVRQGGRYTLKKTYQVCKMSGRIGPKVKNGDYQAPEGFYSVTARQLNPKSQYHLAFNVGYPNAFDRQNGRTGSAIMVHGDCVSIGCFAMTNKGIEEIYGYVAAALKNGQREVPVHIFPFRMTDSAIARETGGGGFASLFAARDEKSDAGPSQWGEFWRDLKKGHDLFERTGEPPLAYACKGHYAFSPGPGCQRIAGW